MREHSGTDGQRAGWSAIVWIAVVLSSAIVRTIIAANGSDVPFVFPLAAIWLVAAVSAVHWTASRWVPRKG